MFRLRSQEKLKAQMFLALLRNVFTQKKIKWKQNTVDNFRGFMLMTKGLRGFKMIMMTREGVNYQSEMIHQYATQDGNESYKYGSNVQNLHQSRSPSPLPSQLTHSQIEMRNAASKDSLLEQIYQRYKNFKSRKVITRCFVAWKYHAKYEKSMSSNSAHEPEKLDLSNSSFLNLSSSHPDNTFLNSTLNDDKASLKELSEALNQDELNMSDLPMPSPNVPKPIEYVQANFNPEKELRMQLQPDDFAFENDQFYKGNFSKELSHQNELYRQNYSSHLKRMDDANSLFKDLEAVIKKRKAYANY